jgi:hypothetical protein
MNWYMAVRVNRCIPFHSDTFSTVFGSVERSRLPPPKGKSPQPLLFNILYLHVTSVAAPVHFSIAESIKISAPMLREEIASWTNSQTFVTSKPSLIMRKRVRVIQKGHTLLFVDAVEWPIIIEEAIHSS